MERGEPVMKFPFLLSFALWIPFSQIIDPQGFKSTLSPQTPPPPPIKPANPTVEMPKEYVQMIGRMAYFWGWPIVNTWNRRIGTTKAPEPGLFGGVLPVAPLQQLAMLHDYIEPSQR